MHILLSLLDANLALHQHAARALEKARARQQKETEKQPAFGERAFTQAQLALREAEVRELALLHQTALLAQSLKREETQRLKGQQPTRIVLTEMALQAQDKALEGSQRSIEQSAGALITILLAQHEALMRAAVLFKALDPRLILLDPDAEADVLKTYALAGDSAHKLRALVSAEVKAGRPRQLAAALEARRRKQRQHMTRLSNARRHFAAFVYQHFALADAL